MSFQVSVIIPVYNAALYLERAIRSVLNQKEVAEIIIVNDGSTDDSLSIILEFQRNHPLIKLFSHENGINKGRSASRNLGIHRATNDYIAFLDADDYYLSDRFKKDALILSKEPKIDGVYNAIGSDFEIEVSNEQRKKWNRITLWEHINPEHLFEHMTPIGNKGYFSGNGLTIRKSIFKEIGFFNEALEVAEDTELYLKMALQCTLVAGDILNPVALRVVHDSNIFKNNELLYRENTKEMYVSLLSWFKSKDVKGRKLILLWKSLWRFRKRNFSYWSNFRFWMKLVFKYPELVKYKATFRPLLQS